MGFFSRQSYLVLYYPNETARHDQAQLTTNKMDTEEYLETIKEKSYHMWKCCYWRNKLERWDEDFVPLDDMSVDQLCKYYLSTLDILNNNQQKEHNV